MSFKRRRWLGIAGATVFLALTVLVFWKNFGQSNDPLKDSFAGNSEKLERTVVVPTLDTPIPSDKSAIWCSSFQLAWNGLKKDVAQGPIQLKNAEGLADRLNRGEQTDSDLDAQDVYTAAGFVNGIVERIQTELGRKFPDVPTPALDPPADGAVAYGFMKTQVNFTTPFFDNNEKFTFTDSTGRSTRVKSFGTRKGYSDEQLHEQVQILYRPTVTEDMLYQEQHVEEFIVDPCKYSQPYQIILASISRKPTLAEAVAEVYKKITEQPTDVAHSHVDSHDSLLTPSMHWRVDHHFRELEGKDKQFLNPALNGLYLDTAFQMIQFRLDRNGAALESNSYTYLSGSPAHFRVSRPFLIIMKKRDSKQPFFVMWVDNAELLDK